MKRTITTPHAPAAIGPYCQGYLAGNTLFVSGQIPFVPSTMTLVSEDIREQAQQSLENLAAVVTEAGFEITDIVKCQVFLRDMNDFTAVNEVYASFFGTHTPARIAVEVSRLPKDVGVEIDAICVKG